MTQLTNTRPNIVIVIPTLKGAGAERVMLTLAASLKSNGCHVSIVVFNNIVELDSDFDNVFHFKQYYRWVPRALRGYLLSFLLDRFIKINCDAPDLLLSNLLIADRLVVHSRYNKHIIIHNTVSSEIKCLDVTYQEYKSLYQGQSLVCVSRGVMCDLTRVLVDQPIDKVRYIYNPVDKPYIERCAAEDFEKLTNNYIIHVGSFSPSKRHDVLINAYFESGIEQPLLLLGKGKLESDIKNLVASLGLEERVIFAGFKSNPYPYIKNAMLLVLSSDYEGLPTVLLEAVALSIPVVSTDCESGPSEMLPDRNLCSVGDSKGLGGLIRQAVMYPEDYVVELTREFTPEHACEQYLKLING